MTTPENNWSFETKQIHMARRPTRRPTPARCRSTRPLRTFNNTDHAAALFGLAEPGNIYTRLMNPTTDVVEQRIAALEGGVAALFLSSSRSPRRPFAILNLAAAGDHIVASPRLLRRHLQPAAPHPAQAGHRDHLRRGPRRPGLLAGRGSAQHQGVLRRDDLQPEDRHPRHPRGVQGGPRQRRAADRGQHHRHPVPDPAAGSRCRHRGALGHQVPGRAWNRHRRRDRRRRHLRLEVGQVPRLHQSGSELPRCGVRRPGRAGLRAQGAGATAARPRVGRLTVQRLPDRPGAGDAEPAHRAARAERPEGGEFLEGHDDVISVNYAGLPSSPWYERGKKLAPREPARCCPSNWPVAWRPARRSSTP